MPFLHGSQGCATYMRRYIISHFREPMDIASSSLGEKQAVYGGGPNLKQGLKNVMDKYGPGSSGWPPPVSPRPSATTCPGWCGSFARRATSRAGTAGAGDRHGLHPQLLGTHMEGFHAAVKAVVEQLAQGGEATDAVNLLPGFVSPADIRYLKEILAGFRAAGDHPAGYFRDPGWAGPDWIMKRCRRGARPLPTSWPWAAPGPPWSSGRTLFGQATAGRVLEDRFGVPCRHLGMPIGLRETDQFFQVLEELAGGPTPPRHDLERGRLIDA